MRYLLVFFCLLFPLGSYAQPTEDLRLTIDFKDTPLLDAITHLERKFGLIFSFPREEVTSKNVNCHFYNASWEEIDQCLFAINTLTAKRLDDGYVTLRPVRPEEEKTWNLCLQVVSYDNTELPFATIGVARTGRAVSADASGKFVGKLPAALTDEITIQSLGFKQVQFAVADFVGKGCPTITLSPSSIELASVVIAEYLTDGITATPDGRQVNFDPGQAPAVPGFAGTEITRMLALLPGVNNIGESAGNLSIRGGSRDQNLVLWDGIPVYSSGHYFGMISNFNAELVDDVSVWRGQAEAAFGGRVSGVIKINTDREITERLRAGAELNLLGVNAFVKAPLIKGKSDLHLGYTASMNGLLEAATYQSYRAQVFQGDAFEKILNAAENDLTITEDFDFKEFNGRWQYNFNDQQQLTISGFLQRDDYGYLLGRVPRTFSENIETNNAGASLNYVHRFSERRQLSIQAALTDFSNLGNTGFVNLRNAISENRSSALQETSIRVNYDVPVRDNDVLKLGTQLQRYGHELDFSFSNELADTLNRVSVTDGSADAIAAFGTYVWSPEGSPWRAEFGLRMQYYQPTEKVYPEPRISGSFRLNDQWILKAGYGENHQFPLEIITFDAQRLSATTPLWTMADGQRTRVLASKESSFGISGQPKGWLIDLELYHKQVDGLSTLGSTLQNEGFLHGDSRSKGLDLLIKKRWKNFRTWAIYSLSKTEWRFPFRTRPTEPEPGYFPADNDRRHQLRIVNTYQHNNWSFSLGWRIHSGNRYTVPGQIRISFRGDERIPRIQEEPGPLNDAKLPAFHRLDFSAFYDFTSSKDRGLTGKIGISLLNLYNRNNSLGRQFLIQYNRDKDPPVDIQQVDKLGLGFTPNLMVKVGF
ncbi:TonB-dependent receptor [Neolewinella persica]|uniref:TonB-dependent receptor n=1 Tax=Neolewinella persica TaxID=70998 RepID=UPI00035F207A|nr:TonB-dependent receptor plug domain-containing protein [Neolewinella persica]